MISARLLLPILLVAADLVRAAAPASTPPVVPVETVILSDNAEIQSTDTETTSDFTGHVLVTGTNMIIHCDRLIVVTKRVSDKSATIGDPTGFKSLLALGHVHIQQNDGLREAICGQAQVFPESDKIVLTRDPVVIDKSNGSQASGDVIELYKGQRLAKVHHSHMILPPMKDLGFDKNQKPDTPPGADAAPSASAPSSAAPSAAAPSPKKSE